MLLTFLTNLLYSVFLTTSFFTTLLSLLKSTRVVSILLKSNLSTLLFKLLKPIYERETSVCMCYTITVKQKAQRLFDEFSYSFNT